jgi:hypothetical protein
MGITFGAPNYIRHVVLLLIDNPFPVLLVTWGVIVLEISLFVAVFLSERKRIFLLKLGILFHFLAFIFLGLGSFFFAMCGALVIYLFPLQKRLFD